MEGAGYCRSVADRSLHRHVLRQSRLCRRECGDCGWLKETNSKRRYSVAAVGGAGSGEPRAPPRLRPLETPTGRARWTAPPGNNHIIMTHPPLFRRRRAPGDGMMTWPPPQAVGLCLRSPTDLHATCDIAEMLNGRGHCGEDPFKFQWGRWLFGQAPLCIREKLRKGVPRWMTREGGTEGATSPFLQPLCSLTTGKGREQIGKEQGRAPIALRLGCFLVLVMNRG